MQQRSSIPNHWHRSALSETGMLVQAIGFAKGAAELFAIIPIGAVGALLIMAGTDFAGSQRLFDARPHLGVIGVTALATLIINPAIGLLLGWISELARVSFVRRLAPGS